MIVLTGSLDWIGDSIENMFTKKSSEHGVQIAFKIQGTR